MEEWKEYKLGDIISIAGGFAYKGNLIGKGDNYLLGMGCVSFAENFLDKGARKYDGDCPERYYAKPGDIVLATRQQSDNLPILGMPAIIPSKYEGHKMIIGANLYRVVIKDTSFDNRYLYWLLKTPAYVSHIRSCQSGTTVRMITKSNIEDFVFCAPNQKSRNAISDFIWALDDKIELNRRINANLEAQAQALFKSWFVDFEPFRDGEFVESELGMIPKGWRVGTIGDLAKISSGKRPPVKGTYKTDELAIPLIGASSIMGYTSDYLYDTKILVTGRVGTHGVVMRFECQCWPSDNTLVIESDYYEYVYQCLKLIDYKNLNRGSTQPLITQTDLKNVRIVIPKGCFLDDYEKKISSIMKYAHNAEFESRRLATLRDTLLPRLMSGEIKVGDVTL